MPPEVAAVRKIPFHNPRLAKLGIEVLALRDVRRLNKGSRLQPERPDFFLMLLVRGGTGRHRIDFIEHPLERGEVLLVRPGQVQQWRLQDRVEADLLLVSPLAVAPWIARAEADMKLLALDDWPASIRPARQVFVDACADVDRLRADIGRFEGSALETAQIWHQLLAMLLRLARERPAAQAAAASTERGIYRLFMRELDKHLDRRPSIRELAQRIGYSESTLSRACLAATGHTAKSAVDQRVALEAKRLLVHSEANVAQIATRLGFSETTNFIKFFRRVVETTPSAFRAAQAEFNAR
ncbi:MAG: helix-turn-helix domain-containing protein [Vitreoscilla sp.]